MNWLQDPADLPNETSVTQSVQRDPGYYVPNEQDWPARICGSLSLQDVYDVVRAVKGIRLDPTDPEFP